MEVNQRFNWTKCMVLYEAQIKNLNRQRQNFMDEFLQIFNEKYRTNGEWIISRNEQGDFMILIRLKCQSNFVLPKDAGYLQIEGYVHSYKYWRNHNEQLIINQLSQGDPLSIFNGIVKPHQLLDAYFSIPAFEKRIKYKIPIQVKTLDIPTFFSQGLMKEDKRAFSNIDNQQFQQKGLEDLDQLLTTLKNQRVPKIPVQVKNLDISTFFSQRLMKEDKREDKRAFSDTDNLQFQQKGSKDLGQLLTTLKNQRITDIQVQMNTLDISTFFSQRLMKEDKRAFPDIYNQQFQYKGSEDLGQSSQESSQARDSQSHSKKYYLLDAEIHLEDLIVEQN